MYVVEPAPHVGGFESVVLLRADPEIIKRERKHLSKLAKGLSRRAAKIRPVVRYGKAIREIAAEASNQKVDLIITATRGHTGLKRVLLGSTAEAIVRHAPCPVLTVVILRLKITQKFAGQNHPPLRRGFHIKTGSSCKLGMSCVPLLARSGG